MTIIFNEKPGCHERHQQRKYNNPLFADTGEVTALSVEDASHQDELAHAKFMDDFQNLVGEILALQPQAESQQVLDFKTRLDRCMVECSALPGELDEIRSAIVKLSLPVMKAITEGAGNDPAALSKLEEEDEARALHFALLENPLIADILSQDSLIAKDELTATLLSADTEQLQQALVLFSPEQLSALLADATALIASITDNKPAADSARQRLDIIKQEVLAQQH